MEDFNFYPETEVEAEEEGDTEENPDVATKIKDTPTEVVP